MDPSHTVVQPGDWFGTKSSSRLSKLIRFFTRSVGESRTHLSHVGVFIESGRLSTALAVEALGRGVVVRNPIQPRQKSGKEHIVVFRKADIDYDTRLDIAEKARSYEGRSYGYIKLVAHLFDWILGGAYVFRRLTGMDRYPICSWVAAFAFDRAGIRFLGKRPHEVSPDDMWDEVVANVDEWFTVYPLRNIPRAS